MRNVEEVNAGRPVYRVRIKGAPPPSGWAVRYVSGMEEVTGIKPGHWLTQWRVDSEGVATFSFEPELIITFSEEADAKAVSDGLRVSGGIETAVVKL